MRLILTTLLIVFYSWLFAQKPEVVVSTGHTDKVNSISISLDGTLIATGSGDKTVKIIETSTGKELRTISGFNQRVSVVKFDKTTTVVAAQSEGEELKIIDLETGNVTQNFQSNLDEFDFCLNDRKVAFVNTSSYLCIGDIATGEVTEFEDIYGIVRLIVGRSDDSKLVFLDYKGGINEVDLKEGKIVRNVTVFKEFKFPTCRIALSPDDKTLAVAFGDQKTLKPTLVVFDFETLERKGELKGHDSYIFDMIFSKQTGDLITTSHENKTIIWDVNKMMEKQSASFGIFGSTALDTHPFEPYFLQAEMSTVYYISERDMKVTKTFRALGNRVMNMTYDQIGNYLVTTGVNMSGLPGSNGMVKIWDLEQNKIKRSIHGFWPVAFSPNGRDLVTMYGGSEMAVWNPSTGEIKNKLNTEGELIQNVAFNKDGSLLAGAGYLGILRVWDMKDYKLSKKFVGHVGGIYGSSFSPDGKLLVSCGMDNTVRIWDLKTEKEIHKIDLADEYAIILSDVKFSPDGSLIAVASWDHKVRIYNTSDWSLKHTLEGHTNMITTIDFSADGRFLASGAGNNSVAEADNSVIVWNVEKGTEHCRYKGHRGMIWKVVFDKLSSHIYSSGDDGTIRVWDYKNCEEVALMASVGDEDYVIATPDNYYMSSKDALEAVSFRIGKKLYPFEQFDLRLNRPDIVSSRLGKTPQGLINAYQYVYEKRLRKMGFDKDQLGEDFHMPQVKIETDSKVFTTTNRKFKLTAYAEDEKYILDRLNVYVNDVPIYGLKGFDLSDLKAHSVRKDVEIELAEGKNKIQVSVHNESGVESLRETYELVYNGEIEKSDLYLITIGVSKYENEKFNLKYAAKDAQDVLNEISKSEHLYKSVKSKTLLDEDVTKENIMALADFLSSAKENDAVIIFVAGHGLLDENLDYYYATHNVNFDRPSDGGVSYDMLESLIAAVKAYQKLLIMDTCHSGELDKEEVEASKSEDVRLGDVEFRAVGAGLRQKEGFGFENAGELMETMFVDVRKGTGATVISSAGGAEFAMESAEWKNGLFTYCLLNGLQSKMADINKDGEIHVSELRNFVYEEVIKLSNGKQRPTARAENLSIDYRVW
ncbi:MAG: caspase family protein [Flavobacteriales bacterium]|nr:caspase family protein [Flavobacteriales bacterium]